MNISKVLGLTCAATLTTTGLAALETELQLAMADNDPTSELRLGLALENQQWSNEMILHDGAVGRASLDARWYDIGFHLDGVQVLDGGPADSSPSDFETTEITARLDYLFEVENYVQILPFVEVTVYPNNTGETKFNWLGAEVWYMTPVEGWELGVSSQYNLIDNTDYADVDHDNHWYHTIGTRYLYQEAPLDVVLWNTWNLASRSFHRMVTGANTQGLTTIDLGGQATLPLPWEQTWVYLKAENHWFASGDDRDALKDAGRDRSDLVFAIGMEWHAE